MSEQSAEGLNPSQAAQLAGIGRTRVYELMASGDLPSIKLGKRRLIRRQAVLDWLARLESQAVAAGHGLKAPAAPAAAG